MASRAFSAATKTHKKIKGSSELHLHANACKGYIATYALPVEAFATKIQINQCIHCKS